MRRASIVIGIAVSLGVCAAASATIGDSGIAGRVVAGPTCPVETVPPSPRCAPRPLAARLRVYPVGHQSRARLVASGKDGRFHVGLPPDTYVVQPLARPGSALPRPPAPTRVQVRTGRYTHITVTYDTGIR